jgi:F-type H+-transporting ATPase subunit a
MMTETILASANPLDHVVAHDLFEIKIGSLSIMVNNHMVMVGVTAVLLLTILPFAFRHRRVVPVGLQNFFESICLYLREEVARPMLREKTDQYIGVVWTTFFFILFANLLGLVPINSFLGLFFKGKAAEVAGTATGNIYVTGALAAFVFVMVQVSGIWFSICHERHKRSFVKACVYGPVLYLYRTVPHVEGKIGLALFLPLFVLESVGFMVKCVALAIRLFANMIAGHLLLIVLLMFIAMGKTLLTGSIIALVSVTGCVASSFLELFVAFLQAYIFTFLMCIFVGMAIYQEH